MTELTADPIEMLHARTSEKWTAYPPEVIPLFVAEMDYPVADVVRDALIARVAASDLGYAGPRAPIGRAFAGFAARTWGWAVDAERVSTTTDVSVAIVESLRQVIRPGDGVVITPPVYPPFFDLIPEAGGTVVEVPLRAEGGAWELDLAALENAFDGGARALLLCSPHNPLGLVHSRETLAAIASLAERYGVAVVSDEIHAPLTRAGVDFTPYLTVPGASEHAITVTSASKTWNLAGLKCALMVAGSDRMAAALSAMPEEVGFRTSQLGLHGGAAAFESGDAWRVAALSAIGSNRDLLSRLVKQYLPGVRYTPPSASYLAWLDFREAGWGDDPAVRALAAGVALNSGNTFGSQGVGFARLNFACSPELLQEAIQRLARA